jgi:hypothetical protein
MTKTIFILGAEGVGKSSVLDLLKKEFLGIDFYDFDEVGVPEDPSLQWRLDTTLHWINKSLENQKKGKITCVLGLFFPEELKGFENFEKLKEVSFCLLNVGERERERRLKKRGATKEVIEDVENLLGLRKQIKEITGKVIDTSKLSIEETFERLKDFIEGLK